MKMLTFNIHHGKGVDKRVDLYRIAEVIEKSGADIIGLNEVDRHFSKRSKYEDQIYWLAKHLNMDWAFGPSISLKSGKSSERQYGNALLSRYPIVLQKNHQLNFLPGIVEGRSLLETTIQINKMLVQIYTTHLSLNPFLHQKQMDYMIKTYHNHSYPIIMMGDFNMKPTSSGFRKITNVLHDVWTLAGRGEGFTYPSHRPRLRLDYLFVSPNVKVIQTNVVKILPKASDHLPLFVKVHINGEI